MIRSTQWIYTPRRPHTLLDRDWSETLLSLMSNDSAAPSTVYKRKPTDRSIRNWKGQRIQYAEWN